MSQEIRAFVVRKQDGEVSHQVELVSEQDLGQGDVLIRVHWSSLNYKDALAAKGHPGIVRRFPHVPGIDAAGTVVESQYERLRPGQQVLITGYELGGGHWGGWAQRVRVPHQWVVPLPQGLSLRESMILGTAGFTAALALQKLLDWGVQPEQGPVLVTGASGGVGSLAVALLAQQGFAVSAVTGKPQAQEFLHQLGAQEVLPRQVLQAPGDKPLLSGRWAAAVDTLGGEPLGVIVRSLKPQGAVAACGLVAGVEVPLGVYPFILRGVGLLGVDSAGCPYTVRLQLWSRLAGSWKPRGLEQIAQRELTLDQLSQAVEEILSGGVQGRVLVRLQDESGPEADK